MQVSLEFKATDENTRFFVVPSTGAALQLVDEIDRPNMGLTLDVGHCLMAGENPAQSCAMVGARGKLYGLSLSHSLSTRAHTHTHTLDMRSACCAYTRPESASFCRRAAQRRHDAAGCRGWPHVRVCAPAHGA